jgi:hypothetical protein
VAFCLTQQAKTVQTEFCRYLKQRLFAECLQYRSIHFAVNFEIMDEGNFRKIGPRRLRKDVNDLPNSITRDIRSIRCMRSKIQ